MEKDRENNQEELNGKVITGNFKPDQEDRLEQPANFSKIQTNPIYKRLFKLTHIELTRHKPDYKSFNKFKPEDLR